jgi:hypothetical protein
MGIGILRDRQQIGFLRMLTFEGQGLIKTMGRSCWYNYYVSNYVKTKCAKKVTCAVHAAHWV